MTVSLYLTSRREQAKTFLEKSRARQISSEIVRDSFTRTVYEIDVIEPETAEVVTEVWIQREAIPDNPTYFYSLHRFDGDAE